MDDGKLIHKRERPSSQPPTSRLRITKLWYFAHPYSGDEDGNYEICNQRTKRLLEAGYMVFSPVSHGHNIKMGVKDHEWWLRYDGMFLVRCNGLILAPEWEKSHGCRVEKEMAEHIHLPILYFEELFPLL